MKTRSKWALIVTCLAGLNLFATPVDKTPLSATAGKPAGVYFTENKGQVHDQNNALRPDVLFSGSTGQMVFHLRQTGVSYQLSQGEASAEVSGKGQGALLKDMERQTICRVDMNWVNADPKVKVKTEYALPGEEHYHKPAPYAGAANVRSFGQVTYESLYPGISLKWYEKDGNLKYDYLVAAGADYSQVQLQVEGAENLSINKQGEVEIKTPLGTIIEHAPLVMQQGKVLPSRWVLKGKVLSFAIDGVDASQPLVIDPVVLAWATFYGGSEGDDSYACKTDPAGNVYITGFTRNTYAIATSGSYQTSLSGSSDAFLAKFNTTGVRLWATYYGAAANEQGLACDVDANGNVYMAGTNQIDAFLVKFNSTGQWQWEVNFGGFGVDMANACSVDVNGNICIAGQTRSTSGISTVGSHQPVFGGGSTDDAFLAKYDNGGNLLWATYYGGNKLDIAYGCATDPAGNIYLVGRTTSTLGISTPGSHQPAIGSTASGNVDGFLAKFNANGQLQWGTYYGGTDDEQALGCATDLWGNIFVAGKTRSSNAMVTLGSYQTTLFGVEDGFLAKFNPAGVRQWGTYYGGSGGDVGTACVTDGSGNVYLVGNTQSTSGIASPGAMQSSFAGQTDAYIAKFSSSGSRQWATYYGGTSDDNAVAVAVDLKGAIYMTGLSGSGLPAISTPGSHQPNYGGSYDALLVKLQDCNAVSTTPLSGLVVCNGSSAILSAASATNTITWYATSTSTAVLGTGTTYTTPALSTGTYTYYASSDACMPNQRTAITVTAQVGPAVTAASGSICPGQSFTIVPSGAVSYSYSSGSPVVSPMTTTVYTVTGESSAGCSGTATVQVTVNSLPAISVLSSTVCSGATATLTASGASTYTWSTGATGANLSVAPSSTTQYTVSGTSSSGCVNTATASVVVTPGPVIAVAGATVCAGTAAVLTASGVSSYTWNTGAATASVSVSPSSTTTYTVSGNDPGCPGIVSQTVMVTVNALPTIGISGTATLCSGQSTVLSATGTAASYTWSTGQSLSAITVSPMASTNYSITGTHANGCSNTGSINITVNPNPMVSVPAASVCLGGTVTLNASGASTYTWNTGAVGASLSVSPLTMTQYTVTGTSASGCTANATVAVSVGPGPAVAVNHATICAGASALLTASGAASYTWSTGQQTPTVSVSPLSTSVYTITGELPGCNYQSVQTTTVTVNMTPTVSITSSGTLICVGQTPTLTAFGATSYTWSTTQVANPIVVNPAVTSNYTVTGASPQGCQGVAVITISVSPCTGLAENSDKALSIEVYPNPFSGVFTIRYADQNGEEVTVLNALGAIVYQARLIEERTEIAMPYEAGGIYFVQIKTTQGVVTKKIVKE